MQNPTIWNSISKHLTEEETKEEKEIFLNWLNESENNKAYFKRVKSVWEYSEDADEAALKHERPPTFREKFTLPRIKTFVIEQALGNLVGFVVGMWVVATFTHKVLERKSLNNLFGLARREKMVVHDIPQWLQAVIAILIGFIVLELINYFFQSKKYLVIWKYLKTLVEKKM